MRCMLIIKGDEITEAGLLPSERWLTEMARFNEHLAAAGVLIAAEGLHPTALGLRVEIAGDRSAVVDDAGPAAAESIASFWLIQVRSMHEAIQWVRRIPNPDHGRMVVEIRRVFEAADYGPAVPPEVRVREARVRRQAALAS